MLDHGPVVVGLHRGQCCHYCRSNADALARLEPQVAALGGNIVLITPNIEAVNEELQALTGAHYSILTDMDNRRALSLNLAVRVPDDMRAAISAAGIDLGTKQANAAWTLPIPATFIVGPDGSIGARFVDPDYRKRMAVEEILGALRTA